MRFSAVRTAGAIVLGVCVTAGSSATFAGDGTARTLYAVSNRDVTAFALPARRAVRRASCDECEAAGLVTPAVLAAGRFNELLWYALPSVRQFRVTGLPDLIGSVHGDGTRFAYVALRGGSVAALDARSGKIVAIVRAHREIYDVAVSPRGDVAVSAEGRVEVYEPGLRRLARRIPIEGAVPVPRPTGVPPAVRPVTDYGAVAYAPNGDLYVLGGLRGTITAYGADDDRPVRTIDAGAEAHDFIRVDARGTLYVVDAPCSSAPNRILVFSPAATRPDRVVRGLRRVDDVVVDTDGTLYEAESDCAGAGPTWIGVVPAGADHPVPHGDDLAFVRHLFLSR